MSKAARQEAVGIKHTYIHIQAKVWENKAQKEKGRILKYCTILQASKKDKQLQKSNNNKGY